LRICSPDYPTTPTGGSAISCLGIGARRRKSLQLPDPLIVHQLT
jgi:hypothetical protein